MAARVSGDAATVIEIVGVRKQFHGLRPLRLARLIVREGERFVVTGLDAAAAEVFVHLVTGATLPDEGDVRVFGRNTREIATDTEWLASLDRVGIVTARAVLLESMPLASNLALPFTVSIDPIPAEVLARVEQLASEVGLAADRLGARAGDLSAAERVRIHLARALAVDPVVLLLEHPTAGLETADAARIGDTLDAISTRRHLAWVAMSSDEAFTARARGARLTIAPGTGELSAGGWLQRLWKR